MTGAPLWKISYCSFSISFCCFICCGRVFHLLQITVLIIHFTVLIIHLSCPCVRFTYFFRWPSMLCIYKQRSYTRKTTILCQVPGHTRACARARAYTLPLGTVWWFFVCNFSVCIYITYWAIKKSM